MIFSNRGMQLLKEFEGFSPVPYYCPAGVWTIGYGTTKFPPQLQRITEAQGEIMLRADINWAERAVNRFVTVKLKQPQFDALVSFTYNVGAGAFEESTLLRKLNDGDFGGAANEFLRWNKSKGRELPGLTRRREAERALFLEA